MSVTTPSSPICVDANLLVPRAVGGTNPPVPDLLALWKRWDDDGRRYVAPFLLRYEVTNAFHRMVHLGDITANAGRVALRAALAVPIILYTDEDLHERALDIAGRFRLPAAYDSHYLALADRLGVEFWTADKKLYNSVSTSLPWVRLAGGQSPP